MAAITPSRFARILSKSGVRREDSCDCTNHAPRMPNSCTQLSKPSSCVDSLLFP